MAGFLALSLIGCSRTDTGGEADRAADAARDTPGTVAGRDDRRTYEEDLNRRLDRIDREWEEWKAKSKKKSGEAASETEKQFDRLRAETREKYNQLKNATADGWQEMKEGLNKAVDDLEAGWNRMTSDENR
jgi:hypothetical protein